MKKTLLLFTLLLSILYSTNTQAQGYTINGTIEGLQDTSVMLGYYFGGKQYVTDTAQTVNGKFIFKGDKELKGGMYLVILPGQQYFDIVISKENFSFSTKLNDLTGAMSFKNSKENPPFYEYLGFITEMQKEIAPIRSKLANAKGDEKKQLEAKAGKIDVKVKAYRSQFLNQNPNIFFSKIVQATAEIDIPESPLDSTGNPDKTFPYRFYKKHFWDNIDFSDARMLRTPVFFSKMDQYLDKLTAKHPDSISVSADILVEKARANADIFQYVVSYITSTYERSKIMGMDAVFVHMVENYYLTKQCDWIDEKQLKKIIERAEKIAPNMIGRVAPEFLDFYGRPFMKDVNGKTHTIQEVKEEFTLLIFYSPDCGHCKKEIPKIKNVYDSLVMSGVSIKGFAVTTEFNKEEWVEFIPEYKLEDWINVCDIQFDEEKNPTASSDWRDKYDIYSTPVVYLLDKDKKILAKRITYKQIAEVIDRLKNKKE